MLVFVDRDGVDGTNNASERELRDDATARRTGRISKTPAGEKRRSIISSVLRSSGKQLERFTREGLNSEVKSWMPRDESSFNQQAEGLLQRPKPGLLNRLVVNVDVPDS